MNLAVPAAASDELSENAAAGITLGSITTQSGKTYRDVELLTADSAGLLFRHSQGVAKVDFEDLSNNLREMFQVEVDPAEEIEGANVDGVLERQLKPGRYAFYRGTRALGHVTQQPRQQSQEGRPLRQLQKGDYLQNINEGQYKLNNDNLNQWESYRRGSGGKGVKVMDAR